MELHDNVTSLLSESRDDWSRLRRLVKQWKELPVHRLALGHWGHASEGRLVAVVLGAGAEDVDHCGPPRPIDAVLEAAVNHQRMMERAFPSPEFDGRWLLELGPPRGSENFFEPPHFPSEAGEGQEIPLVAAVDVVHAAVVSRAFVEADPTGEMGHRFGPRPIRVVLVPGDD